MTVQYIKNATTGTILFEENGIWGTQYVESTGEFPGDDVFKSPWQSATQEEIDAYLLANAKVDKLSTLAGGKETFCNTGLLYSGNTFSLSDVDTQNMTLKNNVLGYVSNNVSVMASTSAYVLPEGHGLGVNAGQIVYVLGFTDPANNGAKTVSTLENNFLVVAETLIDEAVGDLISISNDERYKYYNTSNIQIDFVDGAGWDDFFAAMMNEKDRIMRYYCATKKEINDCVTVVEVDAITIDFSA